MRPNKLQSSGCTFTSWQSWSIWKHLIAVEPPFTTLLMLKRWGGGGDLTEYWIEIHWGGAKRWSGRGKSSQESLGPYQLTFCSADIHPWVSLWINANLSLLPKLWANRNGVYGIKHQQRHGKSSIWKFLAMVMWTKFGVWISRQKLITWPNRFSISCFGIKTAILGPT